MNVSKTLAAAIAATTIVGAVGFAYAQTTGDAQAAPLDPSTNAAQTPVAAPADASTAVIAPGDTQKAAAQDASTQAPTEGTQGTQSGAAPSVDQSSAVTPTPAPAMNDSTVASELPAKADRN